MSRLLDKSNIIQRKYLSLDKAWLNSIFLFFVNVNIHKWNISFGIHTVHYLLTNLSSSAYTVNWFVQFFQYFHLSICQWSKWRNVFNILKFCQWFEHLKHIDIKYWRNKWSWFGNLTFLWMKFSIVVQECQTQVVAISKCVSISEVESFIFYSLFLVSFNGNLVAFISHPLITPQLGEDEWDHFHFRHCKRCLIINYPHKHKNI